MEPIESRIKIIPIEQPFLRILAGYFYEKFVSHAPDFSDILLVFPSQRNKFYFRRYLLEASGVKSIMPPVMKTLDELIEYVFECLGGKRGMLLHGIERNFLLKDTIDKLKVEFWRELPFLRFIAVGNRLLNFFDEMAQERVSFEGVEQQVKLGHYPEKYVQNELPILKEIYEEYRRVLKDNGYRDRVDQNNLVSEQFGAESLECYEHIIICGLAATTVVETELVRRILSELPSELILHSCPPDELEKMKNPEKPFYVHNKLLQGLGIDISKVKTLRGEPVAESVIHIKELKTETEQSFHLQSVLKKCTKEYNDLHRIGLVLPNEAIMYSVTETMRVGGIEYNLSAGLPLAQSMLYSFLGQLHEAIRSNLHYEEFFTFIRHPLFKNAVVNEQSLRPLIYGLEDFMIKNRLNYFKKESIGEDRFVLLIEILEHGFSVARATVGLENYIEGIVSYLNELLGYNKGLLETNAPDIKEFFDQLHRLSALRMAGKMAARDSGMLDFLLSVLKDQRFRIEGDPMRGIQVIGLLEARNLDFDCLILPSMNEGVFPRRSEKDMFINQEVRKKVGLPYTQERENLYYYYFTELTKGKKEVYLSYVAEQERDIASRFINLAASGVHRDVSTIRLARAAFDGRKRRVKKSAQIVKSLYQYVQKDGLSPSALSDYRKCPYRYYLRFILRISEPDAIVEEPGAREWGDVVHKALRNFYKYYFPMGFTDRELDRASDVMGRELERSLKNSRGLAIRPKASAYLDLNVYRRRMRNFLKTEIERFQGGFKIFKAVLEQKAKHYLTINNAQVRVYGYIDRIDLRDDRYYIIDYKTGRIAGKKDYEIGEDFTEFQLPLYALAFSREHFDIIGGMMYYEIARQSRTVDIIEGKDAVAYLNAFRQEILVPTIKEILDPETDFYQTENDDFCDYCPYAQICGDTHVRED
jgi:inactivated superfamily I helicase/RecB family exonuclease